MTLAQEPTADEHAADERAQFGARLPASAGEPVFRATALAPPGKAASRGPPWAEFGATVRRAFETERDFGNGFLFIPVFLAVGALAWFALREEPPLAIMICGAAACTVVMLLLRDRPVPRALALFVLAMLAGAFAAKFETWRTGTPMLGSEITTMLTGRVVSIEHQASGRVRLTLDVIETMRPTLRHAPDRVRATARAVPQTLRPGAVVRGVVRLMPPSGPLRPQSYDFAFNSYFSGIGGNGFFLSAVETVPDMGATPLRLRFNAWIEDWRLRMARHIEGTIGGPEGAIAAALITGIRAGIPEEINEALRITGLYHVISISGLHMALVAGTVMVTMRTLFAIWPAFSMRRPVKKYAAVTALAATAFYLFISGADVAAQRSFIMLAVMLTAILFDRSALTMRNLAISGIIILLIAPHEVVGPSFQMSFAATAALVAAYAGWTGWKGRRARKPPPPAGPVSKGARITLRYAAGLSATSIIAGAATALFTAWHFQQVSPMGLFANLAAMPFVSVIVMPMAVLASLLMPFGLDGPALQAMGLGIAAMNAVAFWLAERSAYDATGAIPLGAVLVLTVALAILTMSGSAVRWLALPLLAVGLALLFARDLPDVLLSEDARLVAVRTGAGIAVNRARPRAFTMQNWKRALNAGAVVTPARASEQKSAVDERGARFSCAEDLCIIESEKGIVAHVASEDAAASVCGIAQIIVIDDATAGNPCGADVLVITKRDLARKGSAEIRFAVASDGPRDGRSPQAIARFSIREPYRAWHQHRQFSREARGLLPWRRSTDGAGRAENE